MKTKHLPLLMAVALLGTSTASAETRVWTDSSGRKVEATFIKLEGENLTIQVANGAIYTLPISRFSADDQAAAKTMKPAANANALLSVPTNASAAQAAAKIDQLVEMGIQKANPKLAENHRKNAETMVKAGKQPTAFVPLKPNAPMSDEQFVRRVYLDVVGRIPSYEETNEFLKNASRDNTARAKLIDTLLASDGYTSHMYNYFAGMLRLTDNFQADFVRGLPYIKWMKEKVATNESWDKIVYEMLTAKGKLWHNGAAGYLLRDSGMPLDNLANTLTVFLGTDVSCAQCHDHPFADWTQRQFYEMAAFFGATSTQMGRSDYEGGKNGPNPSQKLLGEAVAIMEKNEIDPQRYRNLVQNVLGANRYVVNDVGVNRLKLPHDYQYKDGTPGEAVSPKLIMWSEADKKNPAYSVIGDTVRKSSREEGGVKNAENLREAFAKWATHEANPRFAMTIANRLWERAFGVGLTPTVRNIDNPDEAYNPELIRHLASEMVRVKFNIKEFLRIVYNTKAYQREATTAELAMGEPYYFQGPVLRRMSAEQAWDSYMTLVLGSELDKLKNTDSEQYGRAIDMDINSVDAQTLLQKVSAVQKLGERQREQMRNAGSLAMAGGDEMMASSSPLSYGGMVLMRASELPQPAPGGHFLREFGQSDRMLIDGDSKEGSVPQVLMMMNGKAQEMLTSTDSLIFRNMNKVTSPPERVEAMFLSILNRRPTLREKDIAKRALAEGDEGYASMIWALVNTREFSFVQ
ncbi:DUF1549 domain-containing protein [Phragmitibacter flavus]|uniref:DUF1549 domain-containing protein n=1 Tax=Phragmitibacter flavus TaxID=2576071 RepID=A0A5R8KDI5_9BACT|nr:DUF1549 domain-containing protein [Phragmitibacter flavus]TLD69985.1 DUF1549 domain-containing protein [Phragmitibacter flavus]